MPKIQDAETVLTTAGNVRKAAEHCADVRRVLKTLFPTVFESNVPDVGQKYMLRSGPTEYLRVPDDQGRAALSINNMPIPSGDLIYGVDLGSGVIGFTFKNDTRLFAVPK